jgi:hypothetical protein
MSFGPGMELDYKLYSSYALCPPGWHTHDDGRCYKEDFEIGMDFYCPPGWIPHTDGVSCYRDVEWTVSCPDGWIMSDDQASCYMEGWVWGD